MQSQWDKSGCERRAQSFQTQSKRGPAVCIFVARVGASMTKASATPLSGEQRVGERRSSLLAYQFSLLAVRAPCPREHFFIIFATDESVNIDKDIQFQVEQH